LVVTVPLVARRGTAVPQPVEFNHRKHTEELGLNCEFCHARVRQGGHAGLPDAQTCSMCHSVPQGTSEEAARVTELITQGDPLRFNKLFRLDPHVFYTHRRHVALRPPRRPLVQVTMDFCMDCHREQGQTLDCNACHR
jgi:hypothetical protein